MHEFWKEFLKEARKRSQKVSREAYKPKERWFGKECSWCGFGFCLGFYCAESLPVVVA